jgi:hypothetical protein
VVMLLLPQRGASVKQFKLGLQLFVMLGQTFAVVVPQRVTDVTHSGA